MANQKHTAPKPLKLAFIGGSISSAIGRTHHIASQLDGCWKVVAGAFSRNRDLNQATGSAWGVEKGRVYDQWRQMLTREKNKIDAVALLTGSPSHFEAIQEILKMQIPLICEKPLAMNTQEIQKIKKSFSAKKNFLVSIFNYTGYPMIRELREHIRMKEFGKVQQIQIEMPQEGYVPPPQFARNAKPQAWRLKDGKIPMLCLDLGTHIDHLIRFLTDEGPSEVCADFANFSKFKGLTDYASMLLRFKSGMRGNLWFTKTAIGVRNGLKVRIYGEKASAEWVQLSPEDLVINSLDGSREILDRGGSCRVARELRYQRMKTGHPAGFIEAFANHYADLAMGLREFQEKKKYSSPYICDFETAARGIEFLEAASRSGRSHRWVSL